MLKEFLLSTARDINEWKNLPPDVIGASSITSFKRKLDEHTDTTEKCIKSGSSTSAYN